MNRVTSRPGLADIIRLGIAAAFFTIFLVVIPVTANAADTPNLSDYRGKVVVLVFGPPGVFRAGAIMERHLGFKSGKTDEYEAAIVAALGKTL